MVVSVGALVDSKGQETFIRAIAGLVDKYPLLQAWILGEGPLRGFLEKLAYKLGLKDRIHLLGKRPNEELIYWFSAANLSCLTSRREGWPNVVTESLACGTPVVATDVGGIPEILHSPQLGVIVKQNPEDVAEGIHMALSKEWNHEAISRETRMRSWEKVATEVEQTLQAAIARYKQKLRKSS